MAFKAKDGSRHTNRNTMVAADARFDSKQPIKKIGGGGGRQAAGDSGMLGEPEDGQGADEQDGAALAAEHGPAEVLEVTHRGGHHVHAEHPDGHAHDTEHESAGAAHKFAADCAGCGEGEPDHDAGGAEDMF